jgi:hypothetical protein
MSLTLPDSLASLVEFAPRLIPPARELRSSGDETVQRLIPLGQRWVFNCVVKAQTYAQAMAWAALLEQSDQLQTLTIPQPGLAIGSPGSSVQVDGSGQTGNVLKLKGLPAAYAAKQGQFIAVITGGVRYVYRLRADATANGSGVLDAPVNPLIRQAHLNNDAVEVAAPKVTGFVTLSTPSSAININRHVPTIAFTIEERA